MKSSGLAVTGLVVACIRVGVCHAGFAWTITTPAELTTEADRRAATPGGPLELDGQQVLYAEPPDAPGPNAPFDGVDFGDDGEVDALANQRDAFFREVVVNNADLILSLDGDAFQTTAAFYEQPPGLSGLFYRQTDLYAENPGPMPDKVEDLDALELWGPIGTPSADGSSGWDANVYSLTGEPGGMSIFSRPTVGGASVPLISRAEVWAAVQTLGFSGPESSVDVDGLMASFHSSPISWNAGDEILFSIRAAANWDGGEIVHWTKGQPPLFLWHGGHSWNTEFPVAATFGGSSEEVDALEAVGASWTSPGGGPGGGDARDIPGWGGTDLGAATPGLEPEFDVQQRYTNTLGVTAFDLTKILEGEHEITRAIHDRFSHHVVSTCEPSGTAIHWDGGSVGPGESTWACFSTTRNDKPKVASVYWTDENHRILGPAGPGVSGYPAYTTSGTVEFNIEHHWRDWLGAGWPITQDEYYGLPMGELAITTVAFALTDFRRPLEALNESLYSDPAIAWQALPGATLSYGQGRTYSLGAIPAGDWVLVRFTANSEGRTSEEIFQFGLRVPTTGVNPTDEQPSGRGALLRDPIPNPVGRRTSLTYELPSPGQVRLDLFDASGRLVRRLADLMSEPGTHTIHWDTRDDLGRPVASGLYWARFRLDEVMIGSKRLSVLR